MDQKLPVEPTPHEGVLTSAEAIACARSARRSFVALPALRGQRSREAGQGASLSCDDRAMTTDRLGMREGPLGFSKATEEDQAPRSPEVCGGVLGPRRNQRIVFA